MKIISIVSITVFLIIDIPAFGDDSLVHAGSIEVNIGRLVNYSLYMGNSTYAAAERPVNHQYFSLQLSNPVIEVGYFIFDDLSFGGGLIYDIAQDKNISGSQKRLFVNPFVKFYIPVTERFIINYVGRLGLEDQRLFGESVETVQLYAGMGIAFNYFFYKSIGMYSGFDYKVRFNSISGKSNGTGYEEYSFSIGSVILLELK